MSLEISKTVEGWFIRNGEAEAGPFTFLKEIEEQADKLATDLNVESGEILQAIFRLKVTSHGAKGKETSVTPKHLEHINLIEDPSLTTYPVVVDAIVSSTSIAYAVPKSLALIIKGKDDSVEEVQKDIHPFDPVNIKLVGVSEDTKHFRLCRFFGVRNNAQIEENSYRTVYRIRVRPPVFTLEQRGGKIVDERNFEYKPYDIYIVTEEQIDFQPSSLIRIEGLILPHPKTQKITILGYDIEFPEEISRFNLEALKRLKAKMDPLTPKERVEWVLTNFEKYTHIIGRRNLAFNGFLAYYSPLYVRLNGEVRKGWVNNTFIGDTTTGKSETMRKMIFLLNGGMLITAETASQVGLTGTATQAEREGWFVDWGFLVLCDRKLLAIDGAHKLSLPQWAALAEAERSGKVTIAKAAKNEAYARTRQIKIANPVDRENKTRSTKSLSEFLYPCQALATVFDKVTIARMDAVAFADQRDVKVEEINQLFRGEYDVDLKLLSESLRWCWSGYAHVKFTQEAEQYLLRKATELYNKFYCELVPLVNADMKWKIARLSAACAFLTLSTDEDFRTVTVTKDHVEIIVRFLEEEYSKAGLNILAQELRHEQLTEDDVQIILNKIVSATGGRIDWDEAKEIIKFMVLHGRVTRDQLKTEFGLAETNELRPLLATLSNERLIRSGRGLYPEPKMIQIYKIMTNFIKVTKFTNQKREGGAPLAKTKGGEGFKKMFGNHGNLGKTEKPEKKPVSETGSSGRLLYRECEVCGSPYGRLHLIPGEG
ncbi:hypothetical protein DRO69_14450, partial [Candidatus Bathyarchaeota archaeon]